MKRIILSILFSLFISFAFCQVKSAADIVKQVSSDTTTTGGDVEAYVKKESTGGRLDYNRYLENEPGSFFLYDGIAYNKNNFAILLWGRSVKRLGISSVKQAEKLWEDINKRELTKPEKKALAKGFQE